MGMKVIYRSFLFAGIMLCLCMLVIKNDSMAAEREGSMGTLEYECRDNILYLYSQEPGAKMPDFIGKCYAPWKEWKEEIRTVVISNYITNIGAYAFSECDNLETVQIQGTEMKEIGAYAFFKCTNLKNIEWPDSITDIQTYAFYMCDGLQYVKIPDMVTNIGACAFAGNIGLREIEFGRDNLRQIAYGAFQGCIQLTHVTIPESIERVGGYAFAECDMLKSVRIPEQGTVEFFSEDVFDRCDRVTIYVCKTGYLWNNWYDTSRLKLLNVLSGDNSIYEFTLNGQKQYVAAYTGIEVRPVVEVKRNGVALTEKEDYIVTYVNNINTGKAETVIEGIGSYIGEHRLEFMIIKSDISDLDTTTDTPVLEEDGRKEQDDTLTEKKKITRCQIKKIARQKFTGRKIIPEIKVYDDGRRLKKGKDYKLFFANNIAIGHKATVMVTGIGDYTGRKQCYFSIIMPRPIIKVTTEKGKKVIIRLKNSPKNAKIYVYYKTENDTVWSAPRMYKNKKVIQLIGKEAAKGKIQIRVRYSWKKKKSNYSKISKITL